MATRGNDQGRNRRPLAAAITLLAVVLACSGCGYRFGGNMKPEIEVDTVHVPPMTNTTTQVGIETIFTNDLILEISRHGKMSVVNRKSAEAVLEGVIRDLRTGSVSRRSLTDTLERRVSIAVDLVLKDRQGRVLWQSSLADSEAYTVLADKTSTEGNLRRALSVVSARLAEKFHYAFNASF